MDIGSTADDLKPPELMKELENSEVKCNIDKVIAISKTRENKIIWLEKGNSQSGYTHIVERHLNDFAERGIADIPKFLNKILETEPVKSGTNKKGNFADYVFNGKKFRLAYGNNGYIVSFYPID